MYAEEESGATMAGPSQSFSEHASPFWRVPWDFAVHAFVGTLIFGIIAGFAVLLSIAVHKLESYEIDGVIIFGLKAAEYGLFAVDLGLFTVFLLRTAKRTMDHL
jgi:hypothetical protein